jgi:hypothetical protein
MFIFLTVLISGYPSSALATHIVSRFSAMP